MDNPANKKKQIQVKINCDNMQDFLDLCNYTGVLLEGEINALVVINSLKQRLSERALNEIWYYKKYSNEPKHRKERDRRGYTLPKRTAI